MRHLILFAATFIVTTAMSLSPSTACGQSAEKKPTASLGKVYGEWRIRVRPDKGKEYNQLIEQKGLPLFRQAGGRMVGWWTTLIGDLYEHVTIWEYDDMAAFEKAVGFLGKEPTFAEFVSLRDPLLAGEESRFLRSAGFGEPPTLTDRSPVVIHEVHRVPLARHSEYLQFMDQEGLGMLTKHGFRVTGPLMVAVGKWSEITYLFRFESLAERDRLISQFGASPDARKFDQKVGEFADEVTTRLLLPAPFAK